MKNANAVALGRLGGLQGGPSRARSLSQARRRAIGRRAAAARWQGTLPELLRPLFWQNRIEDISLAKHVDHVVLLVLTNGNGRQVNWLRRRLDDDGIRRWIIERKGRGLTRAQMTRWVSRRATTRWQAGDAYARMWEER
ncbi:MAG: hypothetical protein JXP73_09425 [Deltaproteobacteria bacterium]|nr:hypothetical protein [Deltaproteobacteria bacterium]